MAKTAVFILRLIFWVPIIALWVLAISLFPERRRVRPPKADPDQSSVPSATILPLPTTAPQNEDAGEESVSAPQAGPMEAELRKRAI